jgi:hypothetical protein
LVKESAVVLKNHIINILQDLKGTKGKEDKL